MSAVIFCYISGGLLLVGGSGVDRNLSYDFARSIFSLGLSSGVASDIGRWISLLVLWGLIVAFVLGGFGIANDKQWGYVLAAIAAIYSTLATLWWIADFRIQLGIMLRLMFDALLLVLLFHPHSRDHRRIWFA